FERAAVSVEAHDLAAMSCDLARVASAIDAAQLLVTPPPGITVDVEAWRDLARWLRGRLALGDLSLHGVLDQTPVELGLVFDDHGQALALRAAVGDPETASAATRAITLS